MVRIKVLGVLSTDNIEFFSTGKVCVIGLWEKQESIETDLLYSLNYGYNVFLSFFDDTRSCLSLSFQEFFFELTRQNRSCSFSFPVKLSPEPEGETQRKSRSKWGTFLQETFAQWKFWISHTFETFDDSTSTETNHARSKV